MVRFWKFNRGLLLVFLAATALAVEITPERFTPIRTFQDDKNVEILNNNFSRATALMVEDRGFNVQASAGTSMQVKLNQAQKDNNYGVFLQGSWADVLRVTSKTSTSFTVSYSAGGGTFDWILVR